MHARCIAYVARRLRACGWDVRFEVEVGTGRYRGWIDLLALRGTTMLCVEVKTELDDMGGSSAGSAGTNANRGMQPDASAGRRVQSARRSSS